MAYGERHSSPRLSLLSIPRSLNDIGLPLDDMEARYFQVFLLHTASDCSGFLDSNFWARSVLQDGHYEVGIRSTIVALGALYKTLETGFEHGFTSRLSHYEFALRHFQTALRNRRQSLSGYEVSQRILFVSVILFACFYTFIGDHKAAVLQIQSGLRLLRERDWKLSPSLLHYEGDNVDRELISMLRRLAVQRNYYNMAFHSPNLSHKLRTPFLYQVRKPLIPATFESSEDARSALFALCEQVMWFGMVDFPPFAFTVTYVSVSPKTGTKSFPERIYLWSTAYEPILQRAETASCVAML
jgi:hypothetical protein